MRTISLLMTIMIAMSASAFAGAVGLVHTTSAQTHMLAGELTMDKYFDRKSILSEKDDLETNADIYAFDTKSPIKAFMLSLAVPGAGEFYNGQKIRAGSFLAADIVIWSGYLLYHKKGADKEKDYKAYADQHYSPYVFLDWWNNILTEDQRNTYSHRLPVDGNGDPIHNREYYENIGKYNQFQVGWPNGINHPYVPPDGETYMPTERATYLDMRKKSNDYFSKASTMIMVSIANHIVSAFDAAISAKRHNKGTKQYSMKVDTRMVNGEQMPFVVLSRAF